MGIWQQRPRDDHPTGRVVAFDIETIVQNEPADGSFPPIPQHQPVTAAFLSATRAVDGSHDFRLDVVVCRPGDEEQFYRKVDACLAPGVVGIGWNSRGFDLAVLRLRAMSHRTFGLEGLARQAQAGRYDTTHCDLADQFSSYGSSRTLSLAAVCESLQIPVKTSVHGSDVGALWRAGDVEAVKRYVAEDTIATWMCWLHWAAWKNAVRAKLRCRWRTLPSGYRRRRLSSHSSASQSAHPHAGRWHMHQACAPQKPRPMPNVGSPKSVTSRPSPPARTDPPGNKGRLIYQLRPPPPATPVAR